MDVQAGPGKNEGFGVSYSGNLAGISDPSFSSSANENNTCQKIANSL